MNKWMNKQPYFTPISFLIIWQAPSIFLCLQSLFLNLFPITSWEGFIENTDLLCFKIFSSSSLPTGVRLFVILHYSLSLPLTIFLGVYMQLYQVYHAPAWLPFWNTLSCLRNSYSFPPKLLLRYWNNSKIILLSLEQLLLFSYDHN